MKPLLLISTFIGFSFYQLFGGDGIRLQELGFTLAEESQKWQIKTPEEFGFSQQVEIQDTILETKVYPVHMQRVLSYERAHLRPLALEFTAPSKKNLFPDGKEEYWAEITGFRKDDNLNVTVLIYGTKNKIRSIRIWSYAQQIDQHNLLVEKLKAQPSGGINSEAAPLRDTP